jgi:type IV secretion system protein VirB8
MNQAWAALWVKSNPESPLTRYGTEGHVTARIQAVTFLNRSRHEPQILQVRFQTALQRSPGAAEEIHHYIATLRVAFGAASSDAHLRALNPLGFKVLEYRREPEVLTALDAGASSHDEPQGALP